MAKRHDEMTSEERSKVEAIRARWKTPEARAEERHVRERVREEFPPARPQPELVEALEALRAERERRGLSLADVAARSGLDRSFISRLENNHIANPTMETLARYAAALGKRLTMIVRDAEPVAS